VVKGFHTSNKEVSPIHASQLSSSEIRPILFPLLAGDNRRNTLEVGHVRSVLVQDLWHAFFFGGLFFEVEGVSVG